MVIEMTADVAVCCGVPLSTTFTVTEALPACVGVPESVPVPMFSVSQAGGLALSIEYTNGPVPPLTDAFTGVIAVPRVPVIVEG